MSAETKAIRIPEKIMRQIRSDSQAALTRVRVYPVENEVVQLRCVDYRPETDSSFGAQLWYFDTQAVDEFNDRLRIFGVLEYSIQYGLHELVDDALFDSVTHRDRYHNAYRRHLPETRWQRFRPWLAVIALGLAVFLMVLLIVRVLVD